MKYIGVVVVVVMMLECAYFIRPLVQLLDAISLQLVQFDLRRASLFLRNHISRGARSTFVIITLIDVGVIDETTLRFACFQICDRI